PQPAVQSGALHSSPPRRSSDLVRVTASPMVGIGASHPKADLLHIGLANQQGAGCPQAGHHGRVMGCGMIMAKDAGARGRGIGNLVQLVLDGDRYPVQGAEGLAGLDALFRGPRLRPNILLIPTDDGPQSLLATVGGLDG